MAPQGQVDDKNFAVDPGLQQAPSSSSSPGSRERSKMGVTWTAPTLTEVSATANSSTAITLLRGSDSAPAGFFQAEDRPLPVARTRPRPLWQLPSGGGFRPTYGTMRAVSPLATHKAVSSKRTASKQEQQEHTMESGWDTRFALTREDTNLLFPPRQREMFSHPSPYYVHYGPEGDRGYSPKSSMSADSTLPSEALKGRHTFAGDMTDRDGNLRQWNGRHASGCLFGDTMHKDHRATFGKGPSVFETAPSQRWRRHVDYEVKPGQWRTAKVKRGSKFPPSLV